MVFLGVVPIRDVQYVISYSYVRSQPLSDPNAISGRACRTGAVLSFLSGRGHTGAFRYIPYNSVGITLLRRAGGVSSRNRSLRRRAAGVNSRNRSLRSLCTRKEAL